MKSFRFDWAFFNLIFEGGKTECYVFFMMQAFTLAGLGGWKLHGIVKPNTA